MKKIMFSDKYGLTKAVLDGRKTVTRRLIPQSVLDSVDQFRFDYYNSTFDAITFKECIEQMLYVERNLKIPFHIQDEVAIAQSYMNCIIENKSFLHKVYYPEFGIKGRAPRGWDNKMFVRAELMPHRIKITGIRVEQLQDITDEDCLKEGLEWAHGLFYVNYNKDTGSRMNLGNTPREAFTALIDKVSGKGTWNSNPRVLRYEFELIK